MVEVGPCIGGERVLARRCFFCPSAAWLVAGRDLDERGRVRFGLLGVGLGVVVARTALLGFLAQAASRAVVVARTTLPWILGGAQCVGWNR